MKDKHEQWVAIGLSVVLLAAVVAGFTAFSVKLLDDYGYVLFILVPFGMGLTSTVIYGYFRSRSWKESLQISFLTLLASCLLLIIFYIEGIVCIIMASPILGLFQLLGTRIGYMIQRRDKQRTIKIFACYFLIIPTLLTIESEVSSEEGGMIKVSSSVVIDAPVETVWNNVVVFPDIPEPDEWIFKTGLAYPISSKIVGESEGAIRYCEFTTGAFVEPIEVWDEPYLLRFSIEEQPVPMKDMLTNEVPGNMYKYFVSSKGEFRLSELENGKTLLEGSTWYYHKIRPVQYWKIWSDYIIHKIHYRVLNHIKEVSED